MAHLITPITPGLRLRLERLSGSPDAMAAPPVPKPGGPDDEAEPKAELPPGAPKGIPPER